MCATLSLAFWTAAIALVIVAIASWFSFRASVQRHYTITRKSPAAAGMRDDAGLNEFERRHVQLLLSGAFCSESDSELRRLARRARYRLLATAGIALLLVLILWARSHMVCG